MGDVDSIKARNKRVEADKAWETSYTRRSIITVLTYIVIVIFLYTINAPKPWFNALVPAIGYFLSTLTMPFVKKWWIRRNIGSR
tara:strand:- start:1137 stop:1388 length:252 start_codon:yes stop_codon:yes gene_type:complete